jgi:hypothetical protein
MTKRGRDLLAWATLAASILLTAVVWALASFAR